MSLYLLMWGSKHPPLPTLQGGCNITMCGVWGYGMMYYDTILYSVHPPSLVLKKPWEDLRWWWYKIKKSSHIMCDHCSTSWRRMLHGPGVIVSRRYSMSWRIASLHPQYCNSLMILYSFVSKWIAQISQLVQCFCNDPQRMISGTLFHSTPNCWMI